MNTVAEKSIFLIDICGTLYRSNTTFDFIRYYYSETNWYKLMDYFRSIKFLRHLNYIIFKIFKIDIIRKLLIWHLKGLTNIELSAMSETFLNSYLAKKQNNDVIEIIKNQRESGVTPVIISATLDCISKVIAKKMNIEVYYSSELAYDKDTCLGYLKKDLLGKKLKTLVEKDLTPPYTGVITDNYSDMDIIKCSKNVFLIQYSKYKDKWLSMDALSKEQNITKIIIK